MVLFLLFLRYRYASVTHSDYCFHIYVGGEPDGPVHRVQREGVQALQDHAVQVQAGGAVLRFRARRRAQCGQLSGGHLLGRLSSTSRRSEGKCKHCPSFKSINQILLFYF